MTDIVRIAVVQMDPKLGDIERNLVSITRFARAAAGAGADIIAFPECALQGIVFSRSEEVLRHAEASDGPDIQRLCETAAECDAVLVAGFLERFADEYANSAAVCFPDGSRY